MLSDKKYLLSIDPGMSSGIALLSYTDDTIPVLEHSWQFYGGVGKFRQWVRMHWFGERYDLERDKILPAGIDMWGEGLNFYAKCGYTDFEGNLVEGNLQVICEKFQPRPSSTTGFEHSSETVEPLLCEGVLLQAYMMPLYDKKEVLWRQPSHQYLVGGKDLADKKKRQHRFLKEAGYYVTNKMYPESRKRDAADDVRSAIAHGLSFLSRTGHMPTYELLADWITE